MTVEASFIFPVIVFVFMGIILLVFYLYDAIKAESDADALLFSVERGLCLNLISEGFVGDDFPEAAKGYLSVNSVEKTVSVNKGVIHAENNVALSMPRIPFVPIEMLKKINVERELEIVDPCERVRQIDVLIESTKTLLDIFKKKVKK